MDTDIDRSEVAPRDEYTHGHHESVVRTHAWRTVANSAEYLIPHLQPGARVLDVGSGPGSITIDIARRVDPAPVRGVDASAQIVAQAAGLAADNGVHNVEFAVDDAYRLDAEDDTYDVVHAHQVLQHLGRPEDALREFRRVLKPGGVAGVRDVDYGGVIWYPLIPALDKWLDVYRRVHVWNGGDPLAGRTLKHWAVNAGFARVDVSASVWLFSSPAEREWWGGSWAERAVESTFAAHAIESGHAGWGDLKEIAAGWREWAAHDDGWVLMPHGEVIAHG